MNSSCAGHDRLPNPTGWRVEWHGTVVATPDAGTYTVYAICAA